MSLTETAIRKLPDPEKEKLIGDDRGLYLRCYPSGRRTWLYRTRVGGSWKTRNLGEWPAVSLSVARQEAAKLAGRNLPESITFGSILDEWFDRRIAPRYRRPKAIETYVSRGKAWAGNDQASKLTTKRLTDLLTEYAAVAPIAANRCLSNWKAALDYGVERGLIDANPLARTTSRTVGGEETPRDRVLNDDEIFELWHSEHAHAPLLRFLLLTGLRISEACRSRCDWITGDVLVLPASVMKQKREHKAIITPLARRQIGDFTGHLFDTRNANGISARLKRAGYSYTPHDLRRTCATRLADLGVAPHVVELYLGHKLPAIMATYNRHEYLPERVDAAKRWAAEVARITT